MTIRRVEVADMEALGSFLSSFRGSDRQQYQRLYHDTFENPFLDGLGASWIAWDGDHPVVHLRVIPCNAYCQGQALKSEWWADFFANPASDGSSRGDLAGLLAWKLAAPPHCHCGLGTPGTDSKVFKLYEALHFDYWGAVPFYYLVVDGGKALRELAVFRRNQPVRYAAHAASLLYLPGKLLELRHHRSRVQAGDYEILQWEFFPPEADDLWQSLYGRYGLIFERSVAYLNWRYDSARYDRFGLYTKRKLLGWVVYKTTQMSENKHFGNMRVGTIVDILADPWESTHATKLLSIAVERLVANGAHLIVANLSHKCFAAAAAEVGFQRGPSNYHFVTKNLQSIPLPECHLTRGDSDGDMNL